MKSEKKRKFRSMPFMGAIIGLACFSMVTVAFSYYALVNNSEVGSKTLEADVEIKNVDIFTFVSNKTFLLGPDGIVKDQTIVENGEMVLTFNVDNAACVEADYLNESNQLIVETSLIDKNDTGFCSLVSGCTGKVSGSEVTASNQKTDDPNHSSVYRVTADIDTTKETTQIVMTYAFEGDMSPYYKKKTALLFRMEAILP